MKHVLLTLALMLASCSGSPTGPTGSQEQFSWTVGGQSFAATSNGRGALRNSSAVSFTGVDCGRSAGVSLYISPAPMSVGTYTVADGRAYANWTPDGSSGAVAGVHAWDSIGGTGSITISSISDNWVSGTFNFDLVPFSNNPDRTRRTLQGSFDMGFREKIC